MRISPSQRLHARLKYFCQLYTGRLSQFSSARMTAIPQIVLREEADLRAV
jgi:hypothetical protein